MIRKMGIMAACTGMVMTASGTAMAAENVALTGDNSQLWMWVSALIFAGTILYKGGKR